MPSHKPMVRRLQWAAVPCALLVLCLHCGSPGRRVVLVFPSQALMQMTSAVELAIYQLSGTEDVCGALRLERSPGEQATQIQVETHDFPFAHDTVSVGELKDGRYAFVASAKNQGGQQFLRGCTAVQLHPDETEPIQVELAEFRGCCGSSDGRCVGAAELPCYDGAAVTQGKGGCHAGVATCKGGYFTTCDRQVLPQKETCNLVDDDCNGPADDVDPQLLQSDRKNCGRCGRVCLGACINGTCEAAIDGGPLWDGKPTDGPRPDAGRPDGPRSDAKPPDAPHPDAKPPDGPSPCTTGAFECLPDGTARTCAAGQWTSLGACPLGCEAASKACRIPSNVPSDRVGKGTKDLDTFVSVTLDTDTGKITAGTTVLRPAGTGLDSTSGIYFDTVTQPSGGPGLGLFAAKTIMIQGGATVMAQGTRALVLLAQNTIALHGIIDVSASGRIGGPGGYDGGTPSTSGSGTGGGQFALGSTYAEYCSGGGGGGGYGANGGAGGSSQCSSPDNFSGGTGGSAYGPPSLAPLFGGSGGAGGTRPTGSTSSKPGDGGGGGGAVQLVAGAAIGVYSGGGVKAGGGGGGGCTSAGGAGGGAGGGILLEAPSALVDTGGVLAANGGGGGGGDCT